MRIAVLGSGAVGGYYGARLAAAGEDVHFLYRSEFEVVRDHGLTIESVDGNWHGRVNAWNRPDDMPVCDVALVCFKSAQWPLLPEMLPKVLGDRGAAVCLMNGLGHEEILADILGPDRVVAGAAFVCAERGEPGVVKHFAAGALAIAPYFDEGRDRISGICHDLSERFAKAGVKCQDLSDGRKVKWGKLLWNVPFSGLSLYYGGITTDLILDDPSRAKFARSLMDEVMQAASACGVELDPRAPDWNFGPTRAMGAYRPSMLVDFQKKRAVELDPIVAEPLRRGMAAGAKLPLMTELLDGIRRILAANGVDDGPSVSAIRGSGLGE